jgi:hypothetical protein
MGNQINFNLYSVELEKLVTLDNLEPKRTYYSENVK